MGVKSKKSKFGRTNWGLVYETRTWARTGNRQINNKAVEHDRTRRSLPGITEKEYVALYAFFLDSKEILVEVFFDFSRARFCGWLKQDLRLDKGGLVT